MDEKHFLEYLKEIDLPYEEMKPEELKGVRESFGYACYRLSRAVDEWIESIKNSNLN